MLSTQDVVTINYLKGHTVLVRELMKEAVWLQPDETLATAARKLRSDNIGCLPVCDDGRILGMITDRDIAIRGVADGRNVDLMKVREAMSVDVLCCSEDDPIEKAETIMSEAHVHRLAVLNGKQQLVGVISLTDLNGSASERRPFEVIFYKEILGHAGLPHHSELMRVAVAQGTKDEAIRGAIRQFEETKRVGDWKAAADGYDVVSVHVDEHGESVEALELTSVRDGKIRPHAQALWERAGTPEGQEVHFWEQAAAEVDDAIRSRK